jgi:adenosylcobinamide kinase / adenosylcobinamide-phosphate guanylyltransferase
MGRITLITGGARSGKSAHALKLAREGFSGGASRSSRRYFIATAQPLDLEMESRIAHHKETRGTDFESIEEPLQLAGAIHSLNGRADVAVLDCLTLWVSNMMHAFGVESLNTLPVHNFGTFLIEARSLADALRAADYDIIVVTGEVGAGIVPDNPVARQFRDLLGWTNQKIAEVADELILMVAGYPMRVK